MRDLDLPLSGLGKGWRADEDGAYQRTGVVGSQDQPVEERGGGAMAPWGSERRLF